MLVGALEVKIGGEAGFLRVGASQHGEVRRARVEPHVERIAAFFVLAGLGTKQFFRSHRLPGLDAITLDPLRHCL
jgi:hypothetical protein